jgi:hypothetical protein
MAVDHNDLISRVCGWIKTAAEGKAERADRYGPSHVLLIVFDDYFYPTAGDIDTMTDFVKQHVVTLPLIFAALYLVGLSGKTHLPFPLV